MARFDLSKACFYTTSMVAAIGSAFALGMYSGVEETRLYDFVRSCKIAVHDAFVTVFAEGEVETRLQIRPAHFLKSTPTAGRGVTVNDVADREEQWILLSGFFDDSNELRLIRRDGTVVNRWPVRFFDIFPDVSHVPEPPATDWNVETHGALALPDGSVVFNFEFAGLVKLDRCGQVIWTLPRRTHHSVERAEGGGFWVPGRRRHTSGETPFPPFSTPIEEDTLLRVSEEGEVVAEVSVPALFYENGLEALLTVTHRDAGGGPTGGELVHLNKIAELGSDIAPAFSTFEAGDLVISDRMRNLLMVVDPDTRRVRWWQIGPWLRQHDPEFTPAGTIRVFNNNLHWSDRGRERQSNIMEVDPSTGEHRILYGATVDQPLRSALRGKARRTALGGVLVTDFENGRVFEADAYGRVVWEYINAYDEQAVAEITDARSYSRRYFTVPDWGCDE